MCLLSKEAYNPAAIEGQQWMKKAMTRASKCARAKPSASMVTAAQLNRELASTRPPLLNRELASTRPPLPPQGTRSVIKATPAEHAGAPQAEPGDPPAPYTDIPMGDAEDILD
jgi:hypothetical protein